MKITKSLKRELDKRKRLLKKRKVLKTLDEELLETIKYFNYLKKKNNYNDPGIREIKKTMENIILNIRNKINDPKVRNYDLKKYKKTIKNIDIELEKNYLILKDKINKALRESNYKYLYGQIKTRDDLNFYLKNTLY